MQEQRNPFELMLNPAGVLDAVARSERLSRLRSRIYRPLDAPLVPRAADLDDLGFGVEDFRGELAEE